MSKGKKPIQRTDNSLENKEKIRKIALEIIEPALQEALGKARVEGNAQEVLSALSTCYGSLLVDLLGRKTAITYLVGQADHLASYEDEPVNT